MAVYSAECYREKMLQWKDDVLALYTTVHNGGGAWATGETLEKIDDVKRRLTELSAQACNSTRIWTIDPHEFSDAYFDTLRYAKHKYDYITKFAESRKKS